MQRLALVIAISIVAAPSPVRAYIDAPAGKLTLPKLLLEFKPAGVYEIDRLDLQSGAVAYALVETIQGAPPTRQKHVLRTGGKIPTELTGLAVGLRVVLMGPDPYGRGLAFINGAWYVSNLERPSGWYRLEYTSAYFDFRCAFAGDLPRLVESCKALLDGREVAVPCHAKAKDKTATWFTATLREPARRTALAAGAQTRPAAPYAGAVAPSLEQALANLNTSADWADRMAAARALRAHPDAAARSVPLLINAIQKDKDPFVRRRAAIALGELGPAAAAAIPTLFDRFSRGYENADDLVGCECEAALRRINPSGDRARAEIAARMKYKDVAVRRHAINVIGMLGPPATAETISILTTSAADPSAEIRYVVARALGEVDAPADIAIPALAPMLDDPEKDVRDPASQSVRKLGAAAVAEAAKMLATDRPAAERRRAVRVLQSVGSDHAAAARSALEFVRDDADERVRAMAREALATPKK